MIALIVALGVIPLVTFALGWHLNSDSKHSDGPSRFTLRRAGRDKRLNLDDTKPNRRR